MYFDNLRDLRRSGKEYKTNCPHCGGKQKLYINFGKGLWHCFRCGKAGRVRSDQVYKQPVYVEKAPHAEPLPEGESIVSTRRAREYLSNRKIRTYQDWYFCKAGKYAERIILPVTMLNTYRGFQARTIDQDLNPRYLSSEGLQISRVLWGLDYSKNAFPETKVCFLTEGIFGSTRIHELGYPSVCSFTKRLSGSQAAVLASAYQHVVLAFDLDAPSMSLHAGFQLYAFGVKSSVMLMKKKGPDDHTVEELLGLSLVSIFDLEEHVARGQYELRRGIKG